MFRRYCHDIMVSEDEMSKNKQTNKKQGRPFLRPPLLPVSVLTKRQIKQNDVPATKYRAARIDRHCMNFFSAKKFKLAGRMAWQYSSADWLMIQPLGPPILINYLLQSRLFKFFNELEVLFFFFCQNTKTMYYTAAYI